MKISVDKWEMMLYYIEAVTEQQTTTKALPSASKSFEKT